MNLHRRYPPVEISPTELITHYKENGEVYQRVLKIGKVQFPSVMVAHGLIPDLRTNLPNIREMDVHDDDILICAHGKAGTHWVWEITTMLTRHSTEYEQRTKESMMLEFNLPEEFDNFSRPRILNTHLPVENLPKQMFEKRCKILFIQRNPKDIMVSGYNHMKNMTPKGLPTKTWDEFFCFIMSGQAPSLPEYVKAFEEILDKRSDHILPLFYEDLKEDPVSNVKKIAAFLEVECTDEFAAAVADKCSFKNLKQADKTKTNVFKADMGYLYRKGEVGDWKNWFTVAQDEQMESVILSQLKDSRFKYRYTL